MQTSDQSLSSEDPLEKEKAAHSSILAWRIPWTVQSIGSQESDTTEWLSLHFICLRSSFISFPVTWLFSLPFFSIWFVALYLIDLEELSILNICDTSCKFIFLRLLSFFFLAALGLRCSEGAFSNCTLHRASLVVWQWVSLWDLRSLTRDQILSPCTGRQILNHWTTREVPSGCCLLILLFVIFFWRLFCLTF